MYVLELLRETIEGVHSAGNLPSKSKDFIVYY